MSGDDTVGGIDFTGQSFAVKSALIGTDYVIETGTGRALLKTRRSFFDETVEYKYRDGDETVRFRYEQRQSEGFRFVDTRTETTLGTLQREAAESNHRWTVETVESGRTHAVIVGEKRRVSLLRSQRGRAMSVRGPDGEYLGSVGRRRLAIRFTFGVELPGLAGVPKAMVLLAVPLLYDVMQESGSGYRDG